MRPTVHVLLAACAIPALAHATPAPPPGLLTLVAQPEAVPGHTVTFVATGLGNGEPAYFAIGSAVGAGPCFSFMGGTCLGVQTPVFLAGVRTADASGTATLSVRLPPSTPTGLRYVVQVVAVRGLNGSGSTTSNVDGLRIVASIDGCTDPTAQNYDPTATVDDGSCVPVGVIPGYAGPPGPDLSVDGWTLCSGTSTGTTTDSTFFPPCAGFDETRFACSTNADATPEYVSSPVPFRAVELLTASCADWPQGAVTAYSNSHIISIDSTNPGCGQYNVIYDFYMDMANGQWGCNGTINTDDTGGRMWMYGRGENTTPAPRTVPGFAGSLGPDLSSLGLSQCGGLSAVPGSSTDFLSLCQGADDLVFGCSTGPDTTAEFLSTAQIVNGANLLDSTCDAFADGAISPYQTGHIISVDDTHPACGVFNVTFDFYMDAVNNQWGCAGTMNTHSTGGRMWVWSR